jgi:hypothetical protein
MKLFTFGCSFTEGQGLDIRNEVPYTNTLANKLEIKSFNLGACGMSNDYVYRKTFELIENYISKEDIIVIQWTHYLRKEFKFKHNDRNYYHTAPYNHQASRDKVLIKNHNRIETEYGEESFDPSIEEKEVGKLNKNFINEFSLKMLHDDYQIQTTSNYIKGLYSYLELNNYKHLHFFGWDDCVVPINYDKILKETFGGYTNTIFGGHPNQIQHIVWAEYLYKQLVKLKYI